MKFFNSKKPKKIKDNSYLSIDIGTEYVKVALFSILEGNIYVWAYHREKQDEQSMHNALIVDLEKVKDIVDISVGHVIKKAEQLTGRLFIPSKAIMGIAGELVRGVSIMVDVEREFPDKEITNEEIGQIIENVSNHTFENTLPEISEEIGLEEQNIQEIDIALDSVYIDGIKVSNPVGNAGTEITYRVYSTFAPKVHYNSIKAVAKHLDLELSRLIVQPYALATAVRDVKDTSNNVIIVDVGGGTTDIALIKNGDVLGTKMFSIGGRTFTRRIQKLYGSTYEDAEAKKIEYSDGKLMKAESGEIRTAMLKDADIWVNSLQLALEDFDEIGEYPPHIYICGGGALLPEIRETLIEYPWVDNLNFKKHPKIELLLPNKLKNVVDESKSALEIMDVTPLALARSILNFKK